MNQTEIILAHEEALVALRNVAGDTLNAFSTLTYNRVVDARLALDQAIEAMRSESMAQRMKDPEPQPPREMREGFDANGSPVAD